MKDKLDAQMAPFEKEGIPHHDLLKLFEDLTFREKWRRVFAGLKFPHDTGQYKFARLQMIRLSSPISAVIVPILMVCIIAIFARMTPATERPISIDLMRPKPIEELDDIPDPEIKPPEPPELIDVEVTPLPTRNPSEEVRAPVEYSPQPTDINAVAITRSRVIMRDIYGNRATGARRQALKQFRGEGTEDAVLRALRWLKKNQRQDGSWGGNKTAITSLALLAYLAHGDTPASDEFGYTVQKAIQYIISQQRDDGHFHNADSHHYTTPIAAYSLSEAYALTKVPMIRDAAEKSMHVVVKGQNAVGGFNYGLKGPTDTRNDTSYFAWCIQAMKAASLAQLDVPGLAEAMYKAVNGVKKNFAGSDGYGGFGYTGPGQMGLTGAGILSLQFLDCPNDQEAENSINWLHQTAKLSWERDRINQIHQRNPIYYWYYDTQAMFQKGGAPWESWNKQFSPMLMKNQDIIPKEQSGYVDHNGETKAIGSWGTPLGITMRANEHNHFSTILCTLMLTVYYRYLPTFQSPGAIEDLRRLDENEDDIPMHISLPGADRESGNHIFASCLRSYLFQDLPQNLWGDSTLFRSLNWQST